MVYLGNLLSSSHRTVLPVILSFLLLFASFANAEEPKKLVTFDYAIADTLSALQQPPLAMAGLAHYRKLNQEHLLPNTHELGLRFQPNFEYLATLEPDAILISPPAHLNLEGTLSRIADVIKIPLFDKDQNLWQSLEKLTIRMGEFNVEQQQAQELINSVRARLAEIAAQIETTNTPLVLADMIDNRHVQIYGHGSLEDAVITQLGFKNAWQGTTNEWGFTTLSIQDAFKLEGRIILLHWPSFHDASYQPLTTGLLQHWLDDTSVSISRNYWPWGGLPSMLRFAESLKDALENT